MIVEMTHIPRKLRLYNYRRYVRLENAASAVTAVMNDRSTIIVTGHFGNWEMAGYLVAALGMRSYAIARDLDNPYLHDFLLRFRQWSGQTILSKSGDFERIQKVLLNGELLISVGDQSAGRRGYFVDFFGRSASTHKAIAILAIKYDAQVIVGYAYRDSPGFHYTVGCSEVLDPRDYADLPNAALEMTRDFTRLLESTIRKAPEQYLWLHNRWKHEPPERSSRRRAA
jgi:KDO2-lipid IV(A) lauroyltransferase